VWTGPCYCSCKDMHSIRGSRHVNVWTQWNITCKQTSPGSDHARHAHGHPSQQQQLASLFEYIMPNAHAINQSKPRCMHALMLMQCGLNC